MKSQGKFIGTALLSLAFVLMSYSIGYSQDKEYSFKVLNKTRSTITKLLVAEPGQKWGYFDIGAGIAPGKSATLVWNKSTNDEQCVQYFKAVYADGTESEPAKFDFCEDDLELIFDS